MTNEIKVYARMTPSLRNAFKRNGIDVIKEGGGAKQGVAQTIDKPQAVTLRLPEGAEIVQGREGSDVLSPFIHARFNGLELILIFGPNGDEDVEIRILDSTDLEFTDEEFPTLRHPSLNERKELAARAARERWRGAHEHPEETGEPYKLDFAGFAGMWIPRIWDQEGRNARLVTEEFRYMFVP